MAWGLIYKVTVLIGVGILHCGRIEAGAPRPTRSIRRMAPSRCSRLRAKKERACTAMGDRCTFRSTALRNPHVPRDCTVLYTISDYSIYILYRTIYYIL